MGLESVLSRWVRLGIEFNVEPVKSTPDVEKLIVDTACCLPEFARLLPTVSTWLSQNYRSVCRHRLARYAADISDRDVSAALGILLSESMKTANTDHFNLVLKYCTPATAKPLFDIDRKSEAFERLARSTASKISLEWGLWYQPFVLKQESIRPIEWIMDINPSLKRRALFNGNLRASILETLYFEPVAGQSESSLAKACNATRKAVREALEHLEFCQLIQRKTISGKTNITIA